MPRNDCNLGILSQSVNVARHTCYRVAVILTLAGLLGLSLSMRAQETPWQGAAKPAVDPAVQRNIDDWIFQGKGVPEDWTHHRLVFSNPGTEAEAIRNGKYEHWLAIVNDPRFILQQIKHSGAAAVLEGSNVAPASAPSAVSAASAASEGPGGISSSGPNAGKAAALKKDWSMVLGGSATVGAGMYPAKFSFNPIGTSNCGNTASPDFVAFNTSAAGSSTQATIVAYDNLYSGCTGQVPSVYWAFNTGGTVKTSAVLSPTGSQLAFMQTPSSGSAQLVLLTWAAKPTGRNVTATVHNSTAFTVTSGTLTSMDVGAAVSGTDIPAGDTIATVTSGTAGTFQTAASGASGGTSVTLAITADAGAPDTLSSNVNYPACTAPCMITLTLKGSGTRADTISSPYYDYGSDTLYVGDASGGLHKFHPVFDAAPLEVGSPWVSPSNTALSSPVYDSTTGNVYVGDASGYLYSVNSSGVATQSVEVAASPGIVDSPLVDSSAGQIYAFVSADMNGSNSGLSPCQSKGTGGALACDGIINLPAAFTASTEYTESVTGVGTTNTLYDGAFDNLYWVNGTGNIYVNSSTGGNAPKLMEVPVTTTGFSTEACQSGTGTTPNASAVQCALNIDNPLTTAAATGGPVTEICNNSGSACTASSTDYIFTSVSGSSKTSVTGCASGNACVYTWTTTTALTGTTTAPGAGLVATGGSSGIIIDNTANTTGASNIYYSTLGTTATCTTSGAVTAGGCAVQIQQAGL